MKVLIIEDEYLEAMELRKILHQISEQIQVVSVFSSVEESVGFLQHTQPDLIFMDIHLGDGNSFEIFEKVKVQVPVVYTTAYSDFTMEAFKNQGIDYVLKPYDPADIKTAVYKYISFSGKELKRNSFLVSIGNKLKNIEVSDIAYFMADDKYVFLVTNEGEHYIVEYNLSQVQSEISEIHFFKVNRKYIVNRTAIQEMQKISRGRIELFLQPSVDKQVIVSEDKVAGFKQWLDR